MLAIAVVIDNDGGGIEPMVPMVASLMVATVAAVDGGAEDGVFTTNSHNDDRHPCSPSNKNWTVGWRAHRDADHLSLLQSLSLAPSLSLFAGRWHQGQQPW